MWGLDGNGGDRGSGGLVIGAAHQGRGLVRVTVIVLIDRLVHHRQARELARYRANNVAAGRMCWRLHFRDTGEVVNDGVVARSVVEADG